MSLMPGLLLEVVRPSPGLHLVDLKISGDGSQVFYLSKSSVTAWSIKSGEEMGQIEFMGSHARRPLIVVGSRVWVYLGSPEDEGYFKILDSISQLSKTLPSKLHPKDTISWDIGLCRVQDVTNGKTLFWLNKGLGKPVDVQWNGNHLVICFTHEKVWIQLCTLVINSHVVSPMSVA